MPSPAPNPQAVEAAFKAIMDPIPSEHRGKPLGEQMRVSAEQMLKAVEPSIRFQLLTELAEEFERRCNAAQNLGAREALSEVEGYCRELAAKEESE